MQEKKISFFLVSQKILQPLDYILTGLCKMPILRNGKTIKGFDDTFNGKNVRNYSYKYLIFYFQTMTTAFGRRI